MSDDDDPPPSLPQRSNPYNLNSKVMLTAVVSLSVVVMIVTILHIYARFILRRQARRRTAMQQLRLAVSQAHAATEPPTSGLNPAIIASLPIFIFKQTGYSDDTSPATTMECAVCLSFLEDDEMVRILPNCKHTFHVECIDKWLTSQSTCPICRTRAEPCHVPQACEAPRFGALPTAPPPPIERANSELTNYAEGTSNGGVLETPYSSAKIISTGGPSSSSRLSSFRRMLSREKSSRRIQSRGQEDVQEDVESSNFR